MSPTSSTNRLKRDSQSHLLGLVVVLVLDASDHVGLVAGRLLAQVPELEGQHCGVGLAGGRFIEDLINKG